MLCELQSKRIDSLRQDFTLRVFDQAAVWWSLVAAG